MLGKDTGGGVPFIGRYCNIFIMIIVSQNIAVLRYIVTFCQHNYKRPHVIIT